MIEQYSRRCIERKGLLLLNSTDENRLRDGWSRHTQVDFRHLPEIDSYLTFPVSSTVPWPHLCGSTNPSITTLPSSCRECGFPPPPTPRDVLRGAEEEGKCSSRLVFASVGTTLMNDREEEWDAVKGGWGGSKLEEALFRVRDWWVRLSGWKPRCSFEFLKFLIGPWAASEYWGSFAVILIFEITSQQIT